MDAQLSIKTPTSLMGYQFYKQLRSNNKYSPLDTPCLTPAAALYRAKTAFHHYQKSAAFGYPALQYRLNIPQEKLTALRQPYKPAPVMPPRCPSELRPSQLRIVTNAEAFAPLTDRIEETQGSQAMARLQEEEDMVFGCLPPPRDINELTVDEVRELTDEVPRSYGEITRHVQNWRRGQSRAEFREIVARDGETYTRKAIYYQGPTSPPYIPETMPSLTPEAAACIQENLRSPPPTDIQSESSERPSDPEELIEYYLDKHRKAEALQIEAPPAINPEDFRIEFPEEEPTPNDPRQDMSPVQLAASLPETDIYSDPVEETEVTECAHSPDPLPTLPRIVDTRPSGFTMLQHQPCQHHAHPIAPCSPVMLSRPLFPRIPTLEYALTPPLPIDPEKVLGWLENATLLQELNNETKGKDSHAYLDLYSDIRTLANRMNQINNEILDVKDTLKNTKEEVERLEKRLKVVSTHKQVLVDQSEQLFWKFQNFLPVEQLHCDAPQFFQNRSVVADPRPIDNKFLNQIAPLLPASQQSILHSTPLYKFGNGCARWNKDKGCLDSTHCPREEYWDAQCNLCYLYGHIQWNCPQHHCLRCGTNCGKKPTQCKNKKKPFTVLSTRVQKKSKRRASPPRNITTPDNGLLADNPIPLFDTQQRYAHLLTDEQLYHEIDALAVLEPPFANPMYLDVLRGELADRERLGNFYNPSPELCEAYNDNIYVDAE